MQKGPLKWVHSKHPWKISGKMPWQKLRKATFSSWKIRPPCWVCEQRHCSAHSAFHAAAKLRCTLATLHVVGLQISSVWSQVLKLDILNENLMGRSQTRVCLRLSLSECMWPGDMKTWFLRLDLASLHLFKIFHLGSGTLASRPWFPRIFVRGSIFYVQTPLVLQGVKKVPPKFLSHKACLWFQISPQRACLFAACFMLCELSFSSKNPERDGKASGFERRQNVALLFPKASIGCGSFRMNGFQHDILTCWDLATQVSENERLRGFVSGVLYQDGHLLTGQDMSWLTATSWRDMPWNSWRFSTKISVDSVSTSQILTSKVSILSLKSHGFCLQLTGQNAYLRKFPKATLDTATFNRSGRRNGCQIPLSRRPSRLWKGQSRKKWIKIPHLPSVTSGTIYQRKWRINDVMLNEAGWSWPTCLFRDEK